MGWHEENATGIEQLKWGAWLVHVDALATNNDATGLVERKKVRILFLNGNGGPHIWDSCRSHFLGCSYAVQVLERNVAAAPEGFSH